MVTWWRQVGSREDDLTSDDLSAMAWLNWEVLEHQGVEVLVLTLFLPELGQHVLAWRDMRGGHGLGARELTDASSNSFSMKARAWRWCDMIWRQGLPASAVIVR